MSEPNVHELVRVADRLGIRITSIELDPTIYGGAMPIHFDGMNVEPWMSETRRVEENFDKLTLLQDFLDYLYKGGCTIHPYDDTRHTEAYPLPQVQHYAYEMLGLDMDKFLEEQLIVQRMRKEQDDAGIKRPFAGGIERVTSPGYGDTGEDGVADEAGKEHRHPLQSIYG